MEVQKPGYLRWVHIHRCFAFCYIALGYFCGSFTSVMIKSDNRILVLATFEIKVISGYGIVSWVAYWVTDCQALSPFLSIPDYQ